MFDSISIESSAVRNDLINLGLTEFCKDRNINKEKVKQLLTYTLETCKYSQWNWVEDKIIKKLLSK